MQVAASASVNIPARSTEQLPSAKVLAAAKNILVNDVSAKTGKRIGADPKKVDKALVATFNAAIKYGLDPVTLMAVLYKETRFDTLRVGSRGERGIGQILPQTAKEMGYNWAQLSAGDKTINYQIECTAHYLAKVGLKNYNGSQAYANDAAKIASRIRHAARI